LVGRNVWFVEVLGPTAPRRVAASAAIATALEAREARAAARAAATGATDNAPDDREDDQSANDYQSNNGPPVEQQGQELVRTG